MEPTDWPESIAGACAWLAANDPDVLAAVDDVDRSLIRESLALPPFVRLARALEMGRGLEAMSRWTRIRSSSSSTG